MRGRIVGFGEKTKYLIDGKEVTKKEFLHHFPDKPLNLSGDAGITAWKKPVVSEALACHPRQIKAIMERNARHGVFTEYRPDGCPVLRSQGEKEALCRIEGVHDNNGAYRAAGPRN